ncbi:hypothetical protein [Tateyamaria sp.]|uniref:hypothetical protein n=1 Tax=Tateyamaria sp. TaxID=1929288 RepID=UPI0032A0378C
MARTSAPRKKWLRKPFRVIVEEIFKRNFTMSVPAFIRTAVFFVSLLMAPATTLAQGNDPYLAIKEIAGRSTALMQIDTIYRLSEELVFWQSVALMGAQNGWEFDYDASGATQMNWTIRLENARNEGEIEAKRASIAITRNKYLSDDQKREVSELYGDYTQMNANARQIHELLIVGDMTRAAYVFESQTLQLRRDIAGATYSVSQNLRGTISDIARNTRP